MENTKENQIVLKAVFNDNLHSKDINKLERALELAKTVSVPQTLQYRALVAIADHYNNPSGYHIAFQNYYTSLKFTKSITAPLQKAAECLNNFFWDNELSFSVEDLRSLFSVLEPIEVKLRRSPKANLAILSNIQKTIKRINYRLTYSAKVEEETNVTFRTIQIKNAYYADMTFEEMENEFARLFALMVLTEDDDSEVDNPSDDGVTPEKHKEKDKTSDADDSRE